MSYDDELGYITVNSGRPPTLFAHGEFDLSNVDAMTASLAQCDRSTTAQDAVRVDLADVTFLDVVCVEALLAAQLAARERGRSGLVVVNASEMVRRMLRLIEADYLLAPREPLYSSSAVA